MGRTGNTIRDLQDRVSKLESLVKSLQSDADYCVISSRLRRESILVLQERIKALELKVID